MKWDQLSNEGKIEILASEVMGWDAIPENWNPLSKIEDAWMFVKRMMELDGYPKLIFGEEMSKCTIYAVNPERISKSALIAVGVEFE